VPVAGALISRIAPLLGVAPKLSEEDRARLAGLKTAAGGN